MAAIGSLAGKGNHEKYGGGADDGGPWTESGVCGSVHCRPMYTESGRLCGYRARGSLFITVIIHNVSYSATLFRVGRIEDLV